MPHQRRLEHDPALVAKGWQLTVCLRHHVVTRFLARVPLRGVVGRNSAALGALGAGSICDAQALSSILPMMPATPVLDRPQTDKLIRRGCVTFLLRNLRGRGTHRVAAARRSHAHVV